MEETRMKITKAVLRITVSLLCAVLIFNGLPLNAAGPSAELRHEAFLRGGNAIAAALNTSESAPAVSKAIEEAMPAAPPSPAPKAPQAKSSSSLSKPMWALMIGGFAASGIVIYKIANGPGASIKNCSTCTK
jgi:hypothetical protein